MSNKPVKLDDLKTYLDYIVDCELDVYTQRNVISKMENLYNSLGNKRKVYVPVLNKSTGVWDAFETWGAVGVLGGGILGAIFGFLQASTDGPFGFIVKLFEGAVAAVIGVVLGGAILAVIGAIFTYIKDKIKNRETYNYEVAAYNRELQQQSERIKKENIQKQALAVEINEMKKNLNASIARLNEMYDYDIIDRDYRDIYATSAFASYFRKRITYSLGFDPKTGDIGAYKIYEDEKDRKLILLSMREIIEHLQDIVGTQRELARGIERANRNIEALNRDVRSYLSDISNSLDSIERCEQVQAYNSECTKNELRMMNWMNYTLR